MESSNNVVSYIHANELETIIQEGLGKSKVTIIDVRDDDFQGGHIKGAINFPVSKFEDDKSIDQIIASTSSAETIVFHCFKSQQRGPFCAKAFAKRLDELNKASTTTSSSSVDV
jgi:Cdc25 family phosphatase